MDTYEAYSECLMGFDICEDTIAYSHWDIINLNIDLCGNTYYTPLGQELTASSTAEFANVLQKKVLIRKGWM